MTHPGAQTPAAATRRRFEEADASRLARELYGLEGSVRRLPGERDENFRISSTRGEFVRRCADHLGTQERIAFLRELGYE